MTNKTTGEIF
jgi:hypothetical protein